MIGSHHACARFEDDPGSKAAWERVAAVCHGVSVDRLSHDGAYYVVILGEAERAEYIAELAELLGGEPCSTPDIMLAAVRRLRLRNARRGERRVVHYGSGMVVDEDGRVLGPYRRPQG